ncbi:hypothetical protein GALL_474210 [mine drainage metagenome]|uniref:Uncharacterized protein n=1 Tax=mine drainage metagenome TaxID=410659 RepID=A0A1J5PTQ2_9ZZZZ
MQAAQRSKDAVIEVAPEHKRHDDLAQGLRGTVVDTGRRSHHPALEPGKAFPFAPLHMQVLFQRVQRQRGRTGVAVGAQGQVNPEHKPVFAGVTNQAINGSHGFGEILVVGQATPALGIASGFPVFVIDVNQVNVARYIELSGPELAHANKPQLGAPALGRHGCAIGQIQGCQHFGQGLVEGKFCQLRHRCGNVRQRGLSVAIQTQQALKHQAAQDAQGRCAVMPGLSECVKGLCQVLRCGQTRGDPGQLGLITATHPLRKAGVNCQGWAGHNSALQLLFKRFVCTGLRTFKNLVGADPVVAFVRAAGLAGIWCCLGHPALADCAANWRFASFA